jgi:Universal stress protein UspA and related nucleotide-binding proteins
LATHGRTGIKRLMIGSVAEKVVRHAPCAVLTVKPKCGGLIACEGKRSGNPLIAGSDRHADPRAP